MRGQVRHSNVPLNQPLLLFPLFLRLSGRGDVLVKVAFSWFQPPTLRGRRDGSAGRRRLCGRGATHQVEPQHLHGGLQVPHLLVRVPAHVFSNRGHGGYAELKRKKHVPSQTEKRRLKKKHGGENRRRSISSFFVISACLKV